MFETNVFIMKHILKYLLLFVLVVTMGTGLVSCSDTTNLDEGSSGPVTDPIEINLGFGLSLEPSSSSAQAKMNSMVHTYETTGYTVDITGSLVGGDIQLTGVDLNEPIFLEVTGPIEVSVKHMDYNRNKLSEMAYYGIDRVDVETYDGGGLISVPLELVQGFVAVTVEEGSFIENLIKEVKIGKDEVDLNRYYYSGNVKKEMTVEVEFEYFFDILEGAHDNVIGEGVVYEVTLSDIIGGNSKAAKDIELNDLKFSINRYDF